ncbi:MAG: lipocalin family protein [Cyclobacteriaceae bacterium]
MKKFARNGQGSFPIVFMAIAICLLTSCSKDDGPSQTDLIVGTWTLDEVNGDNVRSDLIIEITLERDGDYEEDINDSGTVNRFTGDWEWNRDEDEITIDYDQSFEDWELKVEMLTADELEVDDGDDTYLLSKN